LEVTASSEKSRAREAGERTLKERFMDVWEWFHAVAPDAAEDLIARLEVRAKNITSADRKG
jgi:hypothetical protein